MSKFSLRLRELRNSRDLTQQNLADYIQTSKSSVNMYERGEREPGLEMVEAIADFFNVDLDYLLGKTDIPNRALFQSYNSFEVSSASHDDILTLHKYKQLDKDDQTKINGEINQMLKSPKYIQKNDRKKILSSPEYTISKTTSNLKFVANKPISAPPIIKRKPRHT